MFSSLANAALLAIEPVVWAAESSEDTGGALTGLLLPLLIIGGLFYFLLILPQRRMRRQQEDMRSALSPGDEVRTMGGIFGTILSVHDDSVILDIGSGTHIRLATRSVAQIISDVPADDGLTDEDGGDA